MKQFKLQAKQETATLAKTATRQEIDEAAKHLANHIEKNPKKAARLFESWLNQKPKGQPRKKAS
ncbi:MAG: hypothetical protein KGP28_12885 [Bdellovibrionales bacterium]|nr:hypothetical protein [Bdellovibrionales bacterium]